MFKFDQSLVRFESVRLKSVTGALGGSVVISCTDEKTKKEVLARIPAGSDIVRKIQKNTKSSHFFNPIPATFMYYNNKVVAIEINQADEITDIPKCKQKYNKLVDLIATSKRDWFFDTKCIFSFDVPLDVSIKTGIKITTDGKFRRIMCQAVDLLTLSCSSSNLEVIDRICVAYVSTSGTYGVSPPLCRSTRLTAVIGDDFDTIDQTKCVNLAWCLSAAKTVSVVFGYQTIECLRLPELMLHLNTVNLPNIGTERKYTTDCGMSFKNAYAWCIGLIGRTKTIEEYDLIRNLLLYLTKKGNQSKDSLNLSKICKSGYTLDDVKVLNMEKFHAEKTM